MLRGEVERQLLAAYGEDGYLFPAYDDYCFANVPHTVTSLLGAETGRPLPDDVFADVGTDVGRVLVVLIDGLGWRSWRRDRARHDLLGTVTDAGTVTPLTSVYPSETTAAMTTFHTGRLPSQHGGVGWNVYEPATGESFEALNFAKKDGTPPAMDFDDVFAARSLYHDLADGQIAVHHVTAYPRDLRGVETHGFEAIRELPEVLAAALSGAEPPAYVFTYVGAVDAVSHEAGTESAAYRETLDSVCTAVESAVARVDDALAEDTLLVITADHGHVDTDPDRNVDLATVDGIVENLATDASGEPIRFAGNPRNVHLHLQEGAVEEVRAAIDGAVEARAFDREEVLDRGLFGTPASETFRRRLPDLVVVPRDRSVWWAAEEPGELAHVGMHGGLHPDEMLVPFGAAPLGALQ